jgi:hypothetical protein
VSVDAILFGTKFWWLNNIVSRVKLSSTLLVFLWKNFSTDYVRFSFVRVVLTYLDVVHKGLGVSN